jgi:nitronate monooxygenase
MFRLSGLPTPIVQAPMAGGPSTVDLAAAVGAAGGLGFLAAGNQSPQDLADQVEALRSRTDAPFGVNLFLPQTPPDSAAIGRYRAELAAEARHYGVDLPEPDPDDDDHWHDKISYLVRQPVPVVSFTFGAPLAAVVSELHRVGTYVIGTVTSPSEARTAVARGVDALCVQGPEAGGHRGTHDQTAEPDVLPLLDLMRAVGAETSVPLIAAGGLATGEDIATAIATGARAVQLGTAYLRTPESGANPTYRAALTDPRFPTTVVTRAYTGRPARGLRNRFIDAHDATAPVGYPLINQLTRPLRAAAERQDDPDGLAMWAGTGYQRGTDLPAKILTERLWQDAAAALGLPAAHAVPDPSAHTSSA